MKKLLSILALALTALTMHAQVPSFAYLTGSSDPPVLTCSSTINNGKVYVSTVPSFYQCSNVTGSYAWNKIGSSSSGTVIDDLGTTTPGLGAISTSTAHQITYVPLYAVDITSVGAVCDGTTDDHVAIQAALDSGGAIFIPPDGESQTECNLGTVGLTLHNPGNAIYGNGQIFRYTGSGIAITLSDFTVPSQNNNYINGLTMDFNGSSGTPTFVDLTYITSGILENMADQGSLSCVAFNSNFDNPGMANDDYIQITNYASSGCAAHLNIFNGTVSNSVFIGGSEFGGQITLNNVWIADSGVLTLGATQIASNITLNNVQAASVTYASEAAQVNGSIFLPSGSATGSPGTGTVSYSDKTITYGAVQFGPITSGTFFSNAGTQLAACASATVGTTAWVSDAAALTPGTTYVVSAGAGTDTVQVGCTYTGSVYAWKTM